MGDLHHRLFLERLIVLYIKEIIIVASCTEERVYLKIFFCVDTADIVHVLSNYNFSIKIGMV